MCIFLSSNIIQKLSRHYIRKKCVGLFSCCFENHSILNFVTDSLLTSVREQISESCFYTDTERTR